MKKSIKTFSLAGICLLFVTNMYAESKNEKGIEYYRAQLYNSAKIFFTQQTNLSATEQAENYYYLGQTYYQLNQPDSAKYFYQKAIETDSEYPFGYIGKGKAELNSSNAKEIEDVFKKAAGLAKKDPSVQVAIAEAYTDKEMYAEALDAIEKAKKIDKKYSGISIANGDMLMKQKKTGEACSFYEEAIVLNPSDKLAYLKIATVYQFINPEKALEYLGRLVTVDPNYIPAYAFIGDINREIGQYGKAIDAYEKFISIPGVSVVQHERYAHILFFKDQFDKSLEQIKFVLAEDPDNFVMHRLQAYINYKTENFAVGFEQMTAFLQKTPADKHIYLDYFTQGQLAKEVKQYEIAKSNFLKALEMDSSKIEHYKDIALIAYMLNDYDCEIEYYDLYFAAEKSPQASDYYQYGQAYQSKAQKYIAAENIAKAVTPEEIATYESEFKALVKKGDEAFLEVKTRKPDTYYGYCGRAAITSLLDAYDALKTEKSNGIAKPLYEEALEFLLAHNENGVRNKEIIQAYQYFASYYGVQQDYPKAAEYWLKILEIDPNHTFAKKIIEDFKKAKVIN